MQEVRLLGQRLGSCSNDVEYEFYPVGLLRAYVGT